MVNESDLGRDTQLRLMAQRAPATIEISDPAQRVVQELAAELLDVRAALRKQMNHCHCNGDQYGSAGPCYVCVNSGFTLNGK